VSFRVYLSSDVSGDVLFPPAPDWSDDAPPSSASAGLLHDRGCVATPEAEVGRRACAADVAMFVDLRGPRDCGHDDETPAIIQRARRPRPRPRYACSYSGAELGFYKGGCPIHLKGAPPPNYSDPCYRNQTIVLALEEIVGARRSYDI